MDYNDYRDVFYFLQYQFYIRGEQHKKEFEIAVNSVNIEDKDIYVTLSEVTYFPLFNFLRNLAESASKIHYAWNILKCPQNQRETAKPEIKRTPRGMKKAEAEGALLMPSRGNKPTLLCPYDTPDFPVDEWKYMMFEIPKGHRKNHFSSMYKSLLVYDAVIHGITKGDIAEFYQQETIESLIKFRRLSLDEYMPGIFCRYSAETRILREQFGRSSFSTSDKNAGSKFKNGFIKEREVDRYLTNAYSMIRIAESGCFKEYPHHFK
jgi:hypothetical protein